MRKEMRKLIDDFKTFNNKKLNENVDISFKNKILSSLNDSLHGYKKLPNDIKKLIKFDKIPIDVYNKIKSYYEIEKQLSGDIYIDSSKQKLKHIGKKIDVYFLSMFGFIELIGIDKLNDRYNTIELYNDMVNEIRSLPDIEKSDNIIEDYNIFRETLNRKESPTRNLNLVLYSRFLDDYNYYTQLINKY
jgi:hypothetical protein